MIFCQAKSCKIIIIIVINKEVLITTHTALNIVFLILKQINKNIAKNIIKNILKKTISIF